MATSLTDREHAAALDAADPLAHYRQQFVAPPPGTIYLDGNSLGQLPLATRDAVTRVVDHEWAQRLIRSWDEKWMELPRQIGDTLGSRLLGAAPGQTTLADSTTVCFYKLASAALTARPQRTRIVTDAANFPTDRYVIEGLADARGLTVDWLDTDPAGGPEPAQLDSLIGDDTALVTFSHVAYRSAHIADLPAITELAHARGALTLWDLSHSAGSVPVGLDDAGVDLAVGCTYKYLNGGPGAPAFLYVAERHQPSLRQPIWGWLGRRDPFAMAPGYEPETGIGHMLSGTPPVLGLTAAQTGIELSARTGIDAIRAKSIALTQFAIELADGLLAGHGVTVGSPRDPARRGGHVALVHPRARELCAALIDDGVIVDFRAPDVIRLGLSPLTTSFGDVQAGVARLSEHLARRG